MQDTIEGYVEHIIFRNEDNGYTVLNLMSEGSEVTCVGIFEYVSEGELLELHGTYVEHATYGQQLKVDSYETNCQEIRRGYHADSGRRTGASCRGERDQ